MRHLVSCPHPFSSSPRKFAWCPLKTYFLRSYKFLCFDCNLLFVTFDDLIFEKQNRLAIVPITLMMTPSIGLLRGMLLFCGPSSESSSWRTSSIHAFSNTFRILLRIVCKFGFKIKISICHDQNMQASSSACVSSLDVLCASTRRRLLQEPSTAQISLRRKVKCTQPRRLKMAQSSLSSRRTANKPLNPVARNPQSTM